MNKITTQVISVFLMAIVAVSWYYGSFLPLRKSQILIGAVRAASGARSVDEFKNAFAAALNFSSPVGQSETIKHTVNTIYNIIGQPNLPPEAAADLLKFVDQYEEPVLRSKQGDGLNQHFYVVGDIYRAAGFKYKNLSYLKKAADVYNEGLTLAPKRPQFLYGLLQIYLQQRDPAGANEVMKKILQYWPDDPEIKKLIKS